MAVKLANCEFLGKADLQLTLELIVWPSFSFRTNSFKETLSARYD
jgi:hypothetical protein